MNNEHFVVLGVARPRTQWLTALGQWSTSSTIPVEFIRCVSVDEVRARLQSDRRHSAVLLGDDCAGVDRDILETARDAKCAPIIVSGATVRRDWHSLGAASVLSQSLTPESLMAALREHAFGIDRPKLRTLSATPQLTDSMGQLISVLGGGGTGCSLTSMAIAGHFAALASENPERRMESVALVDASLNGDQARLHDLGDVVPGLQELVDLHRMSNPDLDQVREHFWFSPRHGYQVLPGLRRHRDWTNLRRRATGAAISSIRKSFELVVADVDADIEGEAETGSIDVEDRNQLARDLVTTSDLIVLTARAGVVGTSRALQTIRDLVDLNVESRRILLVVLCAPRSTRRRSELTRAICSLVTESLPDHTLPTPVMVPLRRDLEPFLHDGAPPPPSAFGSVTLAVTQTLRELEPLTSLVSSTESPIPIVPGHLGRTA